MCEIFENVSQCQTVAYTSNLSIVLTVLGISPQVQSRKTLKMRRRRASATHATLAGVELQALLT